MKIANKEEMALPTKEELLDMLSEMIKNYENLPPGALLTPITHYDHQSLLLLLSALFREAFKD